MNQPLCLERRTEMHAKKEDIPAVFEEGGAFVRHVEWGEMLVSYEGLPAGFDAAPYHEGLPDNHCQCPHWGYVLKGRIRIRYVDREEVFGAGDLYYLPPGHTPVVEEDYEALEFSPKDEMAKTMEVVNRNMVAMEEGS
jgi:hypothetical protein